MRGDTNGARDVFVKDLDTGRVEIASVSVTGKAANSKSHSSSISNDGRFVEFSSDASNLVPGDTNDEFDTFVRDMRRDKTERISVSSDETELQYGAGGGSISGDGRVVIFTAVSATAAPTEYPEQAGYRDVFVRDRTAGTTERVGGPPAPQRYTAYASSVSNDGRFVAFYTITTGGYANWVLDRATGIKELASRRNDGIAAEDVSSGHISGNGRYLAFQSGESLDGQPMPAAHDQYVRDLVLDASERISVTSSGATVRGETIGSDISDSGRHVVFASYSSSFDRRDRDREPDIFVRDRIRGSTYQVSVGLTEPRSGFATSPAISGNGREVALIPYTSGPDQIWVVPNP